MFRRPLAWSQIRRYKRPQQHRTNAALPPHAHHRDSLCSQLDRAKRCTAQASNIPPPSNSSEAFT
ncbi:hypothetical protein FA95DRAFT_1559453 [Auriscalpium vulgare]|uniref:Uncharacterized protein n=1 Tax=Auriscalpium vulgare TaxID=40419 RepID=A0ACB8RSF2_9AGAM|nr:hypothetical protein FA95DRAFT_1559453 [Auriscalpium vulgare]